MKANIRMDFFLIGINLLEDFQFRNVPARPMTTDELAEVEKKASEIERGPREDIDEDNAG
jgi:hypothetical protein